MPFHLRQRKDSESWWVRGSYKGHKFFKCTQIPHGGLDKEPPAAKKLRDKWQKEFEKLIDAGGLGTFGAAVDAYLEGGGSPRFIGNLRDRLGHLMLNEFSQQLIDKAAIEIYPDCTTPTRNRQFYTPFMAVWNYASAGQNAMCQPIKWARPKNATKIENVKKPAEYEDAVKFINTCPDFSGKIFFFMFWTGCRPIEALTLDCKNVDIKNQWAVFHDTKTNQPRGIPLHPSLIPMLKEEIKKGGRVFRTSTGQPYGINRKMNINGRILSQGSSLPPKAYIAGARLGLGITPYTARHTVSNYLTRERLHDERDDILGHAKTVKSIYVHLPRKDLIQAIETLPNAEDLGCKFAGKVYNKCTDNKGGK